MIEDKRDHGRYPLFIHTAHDGLRVCAVEYVTVLSPRFVTVLSMIDGCMIAFAVSVGQL